MFGVCYVCVMFFSLKGLACPPCPKITPRVLVRRQPTFTPPFIFQSTHGPVQPRPISARHYMAQLIKRQDPKLNTSGDVQLRSVHLVNWTRYAKLVDRQPVQLHFRFSLPYARNRQSNQGQAVPRIRRVFKRLAIPYPVTLVGASAKLQGLLCT